MIKLGIITGNERWDSYTNYWRWEFNKLDMFCYDHLRKLSPMQYALDNRFKSDIYIHFDDSLQYKLPELHPMIYYCEDYHIKDGVDREEYIKQADAVFFHQLDAYEHFSEKYPDKKMHWLPHAVNPQIFQLRNFERDLDIGFVGNMGEKYPYTERRNYYRYLKKYVHNTHKLSGVYFDDIAKFYSRCKLVFNHAINNDVNMRIFEALACGCLLIQPRIDNGLNKLFEKKYWLHYSDKKEMVEKAIDFLNNGKGRLNARKEILAKHTYQHRVDEFFKKIKEWGII